MVTPRATRARQIASEIEESASRKRSPGEEGLRCKAAYLLQWRTILLAKERDLSWYDLGGIDPQGNPGVYHFKAGLGGVERRSPGPFERRPRSVGAILTLGSESLYRRLVRVRGRACKS